MADFLEEVEEGYPAHCCHILEGQCGAIQWSTSRKFCDFPTFYDESRWRVLVYTTGGVRNTFIASLVLEEQDGHNAVIFASYLGWLPHLHQITKGDD